MPVPGFFSGTGAGTGTGTGSQMLKLESVTKRYPAGNYGVRDVSFELTSGVAATRSAVV